MKIQLLNKDALKEVANLQNESVDLFVIDPPYANGYDYWDKEFKEFSDFTESWVKLFVAKLKKNGTMWIMMSRNHLYQTKFHPTPGLINILDKHGYVNPDYWVTWRRMKGRSSDKKPKSLAEEIIHFTKVEKGFTYNPVEVIKEVIAPYMVDGRPRGWFTDESTGKRIRWTGIGNVWNYSSPVWSSKLDVQRHSAQKPILLIERLVLLSSNKNDLVIDPFMGCGVTALISKYHERNFIGIEKDKKIFTEAKSYYDKCYKDIKIILDSDIQQAKQMSEKRK